MIVADKQYLHRRHLVFWLTIIGAAVIFWSSYTFQGWLYGLLAASADFVIERPVLSAVLFVLLSAFSAMFAFLSSVIFVPLATFSWGSAPTFLLIFGGWLIGGALTYLLGRVLGNKILNYLFKPEDLNNYESRITKKAGFLPVFLFRLAMPAEIPGYLLGTIRYNFPKYFLATFLAELPFAWGAVYASSLFLTGQRLLFLGVLLSGLIIVSLAFYWSRKYSSNNSND